MIDNNEKKVLTDLARKYFEIAYNPNNDEKRTLWRNHNSLTERVRPLVHIRPWACRELFPDELFVCSDPFYRSLEFQLRYLLIQSSLNDDTVFEPYLKMDAVCKPPKEMRWGVKVSLGEKLNDGGAAAYAPVLLEESDFEKLIAPEHGIDEEKTAELMEMAYNATGGVIDIASDRVNMFQSFSGDISTDLAKMRGLEQIMWDAYDRPEWLHKILGFMRDAILKVHDQAERLGDFKPFNSFNQSVPYAAGLRDPVFSQESVRRKDIWCFIAAQEFTTFGSDMFEEFILRYQIPIMEKFGLVAYGCCEDLTNDIKYLKKINNLRRISVTPFANIEKCADQIGSDYVISWRPSPSEMVAFGFDEASARKRIRDCFNIFKKNNCVFDVCLKDIETLNGKPESLFNFIRVVNEEIENF